MVAGGHGHEGRPEDALAKAVAASELIDDRAVGIGGARHAGDGLVLARVEGHPGHRVDGRDALALEELPELAVDGRDALDPGVVGDRRRAGLDGPVEVVGQRRGPC